MRFTIRRPPAISAPRLVDTLPAEVPPPSLPSPTLSPTIAAPRQLVEADVRQSWLGSVLPTSLGGRAVAALAVAWLWRALTR